MKHEYDVLIIGGGPAGLSAAMSIGRMGRSALVCDDGRPRNAAAEHMNNFVSHDGLSPVEWRNKARHDLAKYKTIELRSEQIQSIEKHDGSFVTHFASGQAKFRKIILAHGVQDRLPDAPGFKELWGKAVFHCPYCHGYEVRGQRLGLIANGKFLEHMLPMIFGLSKDLVMFTNGPADFSEEFAMRLRRNNVRLYESKIKALKFSGSVSEKFELEAVELENGESVPRDGLFLAPSIPFSMKSEIGVNLGCQKNDFGFYQIDPFTKTNVSGVFAAGDITSPMHSVLASAANGQLAGAAAVSEILNEDFS